jgi:hypothetical protein
LTQEKGCLKGSLFYVWNRFIYIISLNSIIKELIRDYPVDALEFIAPDTISYRGRPVSVDFVMQENKKHRHSDMGRHHDIVVKYTFADRTTEILVLVEHWSDKSKFDIYRMGHYVLDPGNRFPEAEILPVALFIDKAKNWKKQPQKNISIHCGNTEFLRFSYKLIRLKAYEAAEYIRTKNKFLAVMASAMYINKGQKVTLGLEILENFRYTESDEKLYDKHIAAIEHFLDFSEEEYMAACVLSEQEEQMTLVEHFTEKGRNEGIKEGMNEGKKEGIKEAKLENARRMLDDGMDIELIARYTGLSPEEIENLLPRT